MNPDEAQRGRQALSTKLGSSYYQHYGRATVLRTVRGLVLVASAALCCVCGSVPQRFPEVHPTESQPIRACAITCPLASIHFTDENGNDDGGFIFRRNHACRGKTRWFNDVWLVGELSDAWISCDGPPGLDHKCRNAQTFFKQDIEIGTCHDFLARVISAREPNERGVHPGEPDVPER